MKALVTGATGLIGSRLLGSLEQPRVLVRDVERARRHHAGIDALAWDAARPLPSGALDGIDVVFHLAGAPVAEGRLTAARKRAVRESRVFGTRRMVQALAESAGRGGRPPVLVNASAVGFYGSRGDEVLTERSDKGDGFLADVCAEWEAEAVAARRVGVRVACARIGIVLAAEGGALAAMRPAYLAGVSIGKSTQWMPWIHVDDVVGLLLHAATHAAVDGPINLCAPIPATNETFTKVFSRALHRPALLRLPPAALRLVMGELADVATASQRVLPNVAEATGYAFRFASLEAALADVTSGGMAPVAAEARP